ALTRGRERKMGTKLSLIKSPYSLVAETERKPKTTRRMIALLLVVAASAALLAAPAAATTPPRPAQPPSAYVQTATYDGCTDWSLQSTYPMSVANPKWVFRCWNDYGDSSYFYETSDSYYWNADLQKAIQFNQTVWDSDGWYWSCTLYPSFVGACP